MEFLWGNDCNFTGSFSSQLRWRNFPLNGVIRPCIPGADVSLGFRVFALKVYGQCLESRFLGVPLIFGIGMLSVIFFVR